MGGPGVLRRPAGFQRRATSATIAIALGLLAATILGNRIRGAALSLDDTRTAMLALTAWRGWQPHWFLVRFLPLAYCEYTGPWVIYCFMPFLAIPGKMASVHAFSVFWGASITVFAFLAALLLSESLPLAALAGLSVATWPYLSDAIRLGFSGSGVAGAALGLAGLCCLVFAAKRKSRAAWYGSCLITGMGSAFFVHCAAFVAGWGASALLLKRELRPLWRSGSDAAWSSALLFVGHVPLIAANFVYQGVTIKFIAQHLLITDHGVRNLDYFQNLGVRLRQLHELIDHSRLGLAALASVFIAQAVFRRAAPDVGQREALVPTIYFFSLLLLSPLTLRSLGAYHILALFPLAMIAWACFGKTIPASARGLRNAPAFLLSAIIVLNLLGLRHGQPRVEREEPAIDELAQWLAANGGGRVICLSSLTSPSVLAWLSDGRVSMDEALWWRDDSSQEPYAIHDLLSGAAASFVIATRADPLSERHLGTVQALYQQRRRTLALAKDFGEFQVYRTPHLVD